MLRFLLLAVYVISYFSLVAQAAAIQLPSSLCAAIIDAVSGGDLTLVVDCRVSLVFEALRRADDLRCCLTDGCFCAASELVWKFTHNCVSQCLYRHTYIYIHTCSYTHVFFVRISYRLI